MTAQCGGYGTSPASIRPHLAPSSSLPAGEGAEIVSGREGRSYCLPLSQAARPRGIRAVGRTSPVPNDLLLARRAGFAQTCNYITVVQKGAVQGPPRRAPHLDLAGCSKRTSAVKPYQQTRKRWWYGRKRRGRQAAHRLAASWRGFSVHLVEHGRIRAPPVGS